MTARATGAGRGVHLRIPAWHIDRIYDTDGDSDDGAAAIVSTAMAELGIGENGCTIDVTANVPPGAGLGSSATLATVIVRALDECFTLGVDDDNVNRIVFECEKRIHGDPSGVDNTLAVYGKPVLFRKGDAAGSNRIELPRPLPLVVGISSTRGNTREQVEKVRTGYEMNRNLYARVFDQIDRLSVAGSNALQKDDYESLGAMMNVCHGLLNAIQVSTPELERMVDIARRGGALGAKLTGAGGGGAVVALCPGIEEDVTSAWRAAGYDVFDTGL